MGLITAILTLPLVPVRGTVWLAERLQEQAEAEMFDESAIRTRLRELEAARDTGDFSDEEIDASENELLERLVVLRGLRAEDTVHGTLE